MCSATVQHCCHIRAPSISCSMECPSAVSVHWYSKETRIPSSHQDTWVKNNCRTSQSLQFSQRNAERSSSQPFLTKGSFFSKDTCYFSLGIQKWNWGHVWIWCFSCGPDSSTFSPVLSLSCRLPTWLSQSREAT